MTGMKTMTATEFKAKCLAILDHVPPDGIAITKRGKTVAKVYPTTIDNSDLIGLMPDMQIEGDIFSTGIKWDAES
jgi:antitoxin (DNA-binding transcriptional repressor) of toxin-antitoxin stability system